jgi:hypothetical protein
MCSSYLLVHPDEDLPLPHPDGENWPTPAIGAAGPARPDRAHRLCGGGGGDGAEVVVVMVEV